MAHAQKPEFVFRRNGQVHLNRRGRQFSRLLTAKVCASAVVMLDTPRSEVVSEYWLPTPFATFPFTSPPVRHRVPSGFKRTLLPLLWLSGIRGAIIVFICSFIHIPTHTFIQSFAKVATCLLSHSLIPPFTYAFHSHLSSL